MSSLRSSLCFVLFSHLLLVLRHIDVGGVQLLEHVALRPVLTQFVVVVVLEFGRGLLLLFLENRGRDGMGVGVSVVSGLRYPYQGRAGAASHLA